MARKLKMMKPLVSTMKPRIGHVPGDERSRNKQRYQSQPWRKLYNTAAWQQLRWSVLVRDMFTCQMCGLIETDTSKLVGDHKIAHRGDKALFFDESNVQTLCKSCHDTVKQREEKRGYFIA